MLFKQYPSRLGNSFEDFDKIIDELRTLENPFATNVHTLKSYMKGPYKQLLKLK